jgi:hypothetical protein
VRHESEADPSAVARASRPLWRGHHACALSRLAWGCDGPLFKGELRFLHAGAARSRNSGRDARATTFSPESNPTPKSTLRLPNQIRPRSVYA